LSSNPPPLQAEASFFAAIFASRPSRPPQALRPPQSAIANELLIANAAKATDANRTLIIKTSSREYKKLDPRNALMYIL
jgi:hypothetical protein